MNQFDKEFHYIIFKMYKKILDCLKYCPVYSINLSTMIYIIDIMI